MAEIRHRLRLGKALDAGLIGTSRLLILRNLVELRLLQGERVFDVVNNAFLSF